ncbi:hypothetical protein QKU48_gp0782 [Fadolivirus algeromassiliense]|uniref:EVE domain-containing protein n=1 Tax=Fadolivirus FV1/VV64 TaxID=3070911 RepID=A0A7D3QX82_9VIRU|nr:hypothetical protein QKU48_gp0782 [Fadolivirus algeromassiliense]QKF94240.1 hypothetical protein Fadolivirus_1_782 [Fadolivirus FV1/VV64]
MKLLISKDTTFWIYVMTKNTYTEYIKNKTEYISFFENKVSKGDIVIIFNKDRLSNGFASILQLETDLEDNDDTVNIFKNNNLNRVYGKVGYKIIFPELIKIETVLEYLKTDVPGFKNAMSFRSKFLKNENIIVELYLYGKKIVDRLLVISEDTNKKLLTKQTVVMPIQHKTVPIKAKNNKVITKITTKKNIQVIEDDNENNDENNDEDNDEDNDNDNENEIDEDGDNEVNSKKTPFQIDDDDDLNEDEDCNEEDNIGGYIPIMIIPCKDYNLPKVNRDKYFKEHYKSCNNCDITNNNNRELCSILDKSKIQFIEITDEKHMYLNSALDAYLNLRNHKPLDAIEFPFIRVMYLNNDDDIYDKCLLITWQDKE